MIQRALDAVRRGFAPAILSLLLTVGVVETALAGSGGVLQLPSPATKRLSGLTIRFDARWVDGTGYRPVRVRVSPLVGGAATANRTVRVVMAPQSWQTPMTPSHVEVEFELEQGQRFVEKVVPMPHYAGWGSFDVRTYEDGRLLRDLTDPYLNWPSRSYYQWTEASPAILVIDANAPEFPVAGTQRWLQGDYSVVNHTLPDVRTLAGQVPINHWTGLLDETAFQTEKETDDPAILRMVRDCPRLELLPPSALPENWINWTCVDLAIISWSDLRQLRSDHPSRWHALLAWVATGPSLCVYGVESEETPLRELEQLVSAEPIATADDPHAGWALPNAAKYGKAIYGADYYRWGNNSYSVNVGAIADAAVPRIDPPKGPPPFVVRPFRQGRIVAIAAENPFPGKPEFWSWLFQSLGETNLMWFQRHGMSMQRENSDFWNLLIPGVGRAPVNAFLFLISLFVIAIGPVNYFLLKRRGKLYLLLVTVPLGAFCITSGLLIYALTTDGVSLRARVRSLTEIDQRNQHAVAWSRQTYYAGMAPLEGLDYPTDAAVYPLQFRASDNNDLRQITWDETQQLTGAFLPSRSTVQYLVIESRRTAAQLQFDFATGTNSVENNLGADIVRLLVRAADGSLLVAEKLADGSSSALVKVQSTDEANRWGKLLLPSAPRNPEGFDTQQIENAGFFFTGMQYWQTADGGFSEPTLRTSVFERRLTALFANDFAGLKPREYLALVEGPVEVSMGHSRAKLEASTQFVFGKW
jgi:hypothetical protein